MAQHCRRRPHFAGQLVQIHRARLFLLGIFAPVHIYMMALGDVEEGNAPMTGIISGWKYEPLVDDED